MLRVLAIAHFAHSPSTLTGVKWFVSCWDKAVSSGLLMSHGVLKVLAMICSELRQGVGSDLASAKVECASKCSLWLGLCGGTRRALQRCMQPASPPNAICTPISPFHSMVAVRESHLRCPLFTASAQSIFRFLIKPKDNRHMNS